MSWDRCLVESLISYSNLKYSITWTICQTLSISYSNHKKGIERCAQFGEINLIKHFVSTSILVAQFLIPGVPILFFFLIFGIVVDPTTFSKSTLALFPEIQHISELSCFLGGNTKSMLPVDLHLSLNNPFTCLMSFWPFFFSIEF